jgi:hypothetical protein
MVGFASGWIARSTVDSSRQAVVKLVAFGYAAAARARRIFAIEREYLDDLVAEARARVEEVEHVPARADGPRAQEQRV